MDVRLTGHRGRGSLATAAGNGRTFGHTLQVGVPPAVAGIYLDLSHKRLTLLWLSPGCTLGSDVDPSKAPSMATPRLSVYMVIAVYPFFCSLSSVAASASLS